jgi:hypothetical protein
MEDKFLFGIIINFQTCNDSNLSKEQKIFDAGTSLILRANFGMKMCYFQSRRVANFYFSIS